MKTVKVWIKKGNEWVLLHEGEECIRVVLDAADKEASQIESVLFDPYGNPEQEYSVSGVEEEENLYSPWRGMRLRPLEEG